MGIPRLAGQIGVTSKPPQKVFLPVGLRGQAVNPWPRAQGRPSLPRSQTFHSAFCKGQASSLPHFRFQTGNLPKLQRAGGRGLIARRPGALWGASDVRNPGVGQEPDGQSRTEPKFPPKLLRPLRDPGAMTSAGPGEPLGWARRVKQAPGHQPQGQCGARPRGHTTGAQPLPQPAGEAVRGTKPLPTPLRGAEPRTRGSQSLGLPSRDLPPLRGAHP